MQLLMVKVLVIVKLVVEVIAHYEIFMDFIFTAVALTVTSMKITYHGIFRTYNSYSRMY